MLTWGEILEQVRDTINEKSEGFFTDSYLLNTFNHRQNEFCNQVRCIRKERSIPIQSDGVTAILPTDFSGIIDIGVKRSDNSIAFLSQISMRGRSTLGGNTKSYYVEGNNIKLIASTEGSIVLVYYAKPTPLADEEDFEQEVDIPDEYINTVILGTCVSALNKRLDFEYADRLDRQYREAIVKAIVQESTKYGKKMRQIGKI